MPNRSTALIRFTNVISDDVAAKHDAELIKGCRTRCREKGQLRVERCGAFNIFDHRLRIIAQQIIGFINHQRLQPVKLQIAIVQHMQHASRRPDYDIWVLFFKHCHLPPQIGATSQRAHLDPDQIGPFT